MTSPSRCSGLSSCDHGLMQIRIEVRAERVDRPHALLAQQVVQLGVNQLDALS